MTESKVRIKGLNELRAVAAFAVVLHHIELYKRNNNKSSLFDCNFLSDFISCLGENGVFFFFVLSGFLITFLLLRERENNNDISIKKFYIRRILRIWPLYYLIVAVSFFVLPWLCLKAFPDFFSLEKNYVNRIVNLGDNYTISLVMFVLFIPNFRGLLTHHTSVLGASHLWSIGVEEQFYLVWPWIVKYAGRFLIYFFSGILLLKLFCNYYFVGMPSAELGKFSWVPKFMLFFKIEFMALGGIAAYFLYSKNRYFIILLENKVAVYIILAITIFLLFITSNPILLSVCFALLISNISNHGVLLFESKILSTIGDFSFGIYMYHPIIMFLCYTGINRIDIRNLFLYNLIIYVFILGITITISYLSYKYFEKPFLKFKEKFTLIKT